jgi:molybdenum-dependent DNA-binding transcriptional regulator ModE
MNARASRTPFTPVRLKARRDGWTPERQYRFIAELAATRSIVRACRAVGMSSVSAYKLRVRPDAASFAAA